MHHWLRGIDTPDSWSSTALNKQRRRHIPLLKSHYQCLAQIIIRYLRHITVWSSVL